jgi:uncharacterized membrane protein
MKKTNAEITKEARVILKKNYFARKGFWALVVLLILMMLALKLPFHLLVSNKIFVSIFDQIVDIILNPICALGLAAFMLSIVRKEKTFNKIFYGFKRFATAVVANIVILIFILLWTLLLIIPGIIASFRYSQTFYIIADNHSIGALEAINKSKEMMKDNKLQFFCLFLRLIPWILLGIITFGIGFIYILPYINICYANFYENLKNEQNIEGQTAEI